MADEVKPTKQFIGLGDIDAFIPNETRLAMVRNGAGNYDGAGEQAALVKANETLSEEGEEFDAKTNQPTREQKMRAAAVYWNALHEAKDISVHESQHDFMSEAGVEPYANAEQDRAAAEYAQSVEENEERQGELAAKVQTYRGMDIEALRNEAKRRDVKVKDGAPKDDIVAALSSKDSQEAAGAAKASKGSMRPGEDDSAHGARYTEMNKEELLGEVERRGIEGVSQRTAKDEIIKALKKADRRDARHAKSEAPPSGSDR